MRFRSTSLETRRFHSIVLTFILVVSILTSINVVVSHEAQADAVVIDFENFETLPDSESRQVSTQYEESGITLNYPLARDYSVDLITRDITGFAHSGKWGIEQCYGIEFCDTPIAMTFSTPQKYVKVWIGHSGSVGQSRTVMLHAFSSTGNQVGEATTLINPSHTAQPIQMPLLVSVESPNIARVTIGFDAPGFNNGLAIDDIEFSTTGAPPEGSSIPSQAGVRLFPLEAEDRTFEIKVIGEGITTVALNKEVKALLLKNDGTSGSLQIEIPKPLLSGNFNVMIDDRQTEYKISQTDIESIIVIDRPSNSTMISVQGTNVIPEFPTAISILVMTLSMITIYTIRKRSGKGLRGELKSSLHLIVLSSLLWSPLLFLQPAQANHSIDCEGDGNKLGYINQSFSLYCTKANGSPFETSWSIKEGIEALPPGLTLTQTEQAGDEGYLAAEITGTPTEAGVYSFTLVSTEDPGDPEFVHSEEQSIQIEIGSAPPPDYDFVVSVTPSSSTQEVGNLLYGTHEPIELNFDVDVTLAPGADPGGDKVTLSLSPIGRVPGMRAVFSDNFQTPSYSSTMTLTLEATGERPELTFEPDTYEITIVAASNSISRIERIATLELSLGVQGDLAITSAKAIQVFEDESQEELVSGKNTGFLVAVESTFAYNITSPVSIFFPVGQWGQDEGIQNPLGDGKDYTVYTSEFELAPGVNQLLMIPGVVPTGDPRACPDIIPPIHPCAEVSPGVPTGGWISARVSVTAFVDSRWDSFPDPGVLVNSISEDDETNNKITRIYESVLTDPMHVYYRPVKFHWEEFDPEQWTDPRFTKNDRTISGVIQAAWNEDAPLLLATFPVADGAFEVSSSYNSWDFHPLRPDWCWVRIPYAPDIPYPCLREVRDQADWDDEWGAWGIFEWAKDPQIAILYLELDIDARLSGYDQWNGMVPNDWFGKNDIWGGDQIGMSMGVLRSSLSEVGWGPELTVHEAIHNYGFWGDIYGGGGCQFRADDGYWINKGGANMSSTNSWFIMDQSGCANGPWEFISGRGYWWNSPNQYWMKQDKYGMLKNVFSGRWSVLDAGIWHRAADPEVVLVRGLLYENNTALFAPFIRYTDFPELLPGGNGSYSIVVSDKNGNTLNRTDFNFEFWHPEYTDAELMPFSMAVEWNDEIALIELQDKNGKMLASREVSPNSPTVSITLPAGGETFGNKTDDQIAVSWDGNDVDGDNLSYIVQISPDGGETWSGVVSDWPFENFILKTEGLPHGDDYLIKVIATDGINVDEATSARFSISDEASSYGISLQVSGIPVGATSTIFVDGVEAGRITGEPTANFLVFGGDQWLTRYRDVPGQGSMTLNVQSGLHEIRIEPTVLEVAGSPARVSNPAIKVSEPTTIVFSYGLVNQESRAFQLTTTLDEKKYIVTGKSAGITPSTLSIKPGSFVRVEFEESERGEVIATFPTTMIKGIHSVKFGNQELAFDEIEANATSTTISFLVPDVAQFADIYGSFVIPEFPTAILITSISLAFAIIAIRKMPRVFRP